MTNAMPYDVGIAVALWNVARMYVWHDNVNENENENNFIAK